MKMARASVVLLLVLPLVLVLAQADTSSDMDALLAFKSAISDPNNYLRSWDPESDTPCRWFHVHCDDNDNVVRVDLSDGGFSGPLSPKLCGLSRLEILDLRENQFSGPIPSEWALYSKFNFLESLYLSDNNLSGSIPFTGYRFGKSSYQPGNDGLCGDAIGKSC